MPSKARITIGTSSETKKKEYKAKALNRDKSISEIVDEVFEQLPLHPTELVESVYIDRTQDEE
jgi:hypothetical protein